MKRMDKYLIPSDFLTSLGEALGDKLGDIIINAIDKLFPPDGGQTA